MQGECLTDWAPQPPSLLRQIGDKCRQLGGDLPSRQPPATPTLRESSPSIRGRCAKVKTTTQEQIDQLSPSPLPTCSSSFF
ncbi:hypothetical protein JTE90_019552 [Oedothorax gibbosus]|uniref:Uncharacterized protein n=1 Tax=Oedothorax gibbosus TaxID=931172 RepID=A0AAV6TNP3_9ARAC|nr:hypothetical protein JTE90_019552 [Oedothorax gibbosus]